MLAVVLAMGAASVQAAEPDGAELYRRGCASCHGDDGAGLPRVLVGFEVPVPDLRDCAFSTAEPVADWFAVVHEGGPARGFDPTMPAFGTALTESEITAVIEYIHGFCPELPDWPRGDLNLPRAFTTEKAFPENEFVVASSIALRGPGSVLTSLLYEQRLGARAQYEVVVPFGFLNQTPASAAPVESQNGVTGGIGDIALAIKQAVLHSLRTGSILSLGLELALPTGRQDRSLGSGVTILAPFFSYAQILPAGTFLQAQASVDLPFRIEHANPEAIWSAVLGMSLVPSRYGRMYSPMLEVVGARELVAADATTRWRLVPQMQVTLSRRRHVRFNAGLDVPLESSDVRKLQLLVYLLWDWFEGSPLEGW